MAIEEGDLGLVADFMEPRGLSCMELRIDDVGVVWMDGQPVGALEGTGNKRVVRELGETQALAIELGLDA